MSWPLFIGISAVVFYVLGGSLYGVFCGHGNNDYYCTFEVCVPGIVFLCLGGVCTIAWVILFASYLKGLRKNPAGSINPSKSSSKWRPLGSGIAALAAFVIGGALMGILQNTYHDGVFIAGCAFLGLGVLLVVIFIVLAIVYANPPNRNPATQGTSGLHASSRIKYWALGFGILSLILYGVGAGLLGYFYSTVSGEVDNLDYYSNGGEYSRQVGGFVCVGLGSIFTFMWLVLLAISSSRKRCIQPVYIVAQSSMGHPRPVLSGEEVENRHTQQDQELGRYCGMCGKFVQTPFCRRCGTPQNTFSSDGRTPP
ncbi:hypothetical protein PV08_00569 [Exophiala spinifera]|uniref:Uncharacterized protein n=1 Tax=Exophiala spinifera TaxID=91928 RepID=A0A0D2C8Y7_9EURO|nr:uncharacterized protein PV08_00569 [Exophiala spinifera]KIW19994.1 hypothetical protein PV08_00569 [Exophiala spinifera]